MKAISKKIKTFATEHPQLAHLYKNAAILFSGNAGSGILSLVALAILTRALGVETFGIYVLITAYIALIDRLVSFQTWQAIIHYGTKALHEKAYERLSSLFFFGYSLDFFSALAGTILAVLGMWLMPYAFGLEQVSTATFLFASSVLLFNWMATPTAILRIFDKFHVQALHLNLGALLKLMGYFALWLNASASLFPYIAIWAISTIIARLFLFVSAWREARQNNLLHREHINFSKMFAEAPGLWKFVLATNLDGIVRILRDADIFIINAFLGTSATALYKIARELARIPTQFTGPFYQAIYPQLSKFTSTKNYTGLKKLMLQSSLSLGGAITLGWLVFILAGPLLIDLAFGSAYIKSYPVAVWCLGSIVIWAFAQPLSPAMMALGRVQTNLNIHLITSLVYVVMLCFIPERFGLVGAGLCLFIFYGMWSSLMFLSFQKHIKELDEHET